MSNEIEHIESMRLYLKEIDYNDTSNIVKWRSDYENIRYFLNSQPLTLEKHLKWFEKYCQDNERMDFIIIEKNTMEPIGIVGLQDINYERGIASVAYIIGERNARGKGYAKEAVQVICRYAFEYLHMKKLYAVIHQANIASRKLVLGLGFTLLQLQNQEMVFLEYEMDKESFE